MRFWDSIERFAVFGIICLLFFVSCMSAEKQDLLLQTYASVVKEYEAERTDKVKLLELYKVKNSENQTIVDECNKAIIESEESKKRVGELSEIVEGLVSSSTMSDTQKQMILDILIMVLPEKKDK